MLIRQVNTELSPRIASSSEPPNGDKPVPVEIRKDVLSPLDMVQNVLGSLISLILTAAVVVVFVLFMLVQREDLRDRIIRLAGETRVSLTTQLLDDAAKRVSRYLLAQLGVNVAFGLCAGIGLFIIGVPNPLLWGMLAAVLRYVPYLGIWIAALGPVAVAFAVEPGWVKVPAVFGLYMGIDLLIYNFVEPLLYGSSTGISPIAILAAAVFWTWLWGPVGLLLATPLTVCVVSIGHFVPRLHFLSVILGDQKVLAPDTRFYQRMLAMDLDEATEIAEEFVKGRSLKELFDKVFVPALRSAEEERHRGTFDESRQRAFYQNTALLIEDITERANELIAPEPLSAGESPSPASSDGHSSQSVVVCLAARDEADGLAAQMLAALLTRRGVRVTALGQCLASEAAEAVVREEGRIACVCAVPPAGYMHARYLCRRLRDRFQDLKIVAAILTDGDAETIRQHRPGISADAIVPSLSAALAEVLAVIPVTEQREAPQPV